MRWSNVGAGCDCMFFGAALRRCRRDGSVRDQTIACSGAEAGKRRTALLNVRKRFPTYAFFRRRSRRPTTATNPVERSTNEVGSGTGLGLPTAVRNPRISPVGNAEV